MPETTTAAALAASAERVTSIPGYREIACGHRALVVLVGPPGSGKSTAATRALNATTGPVLLVSVEEPPGPTLGLRLRRLGVSRADFHIASWVNVDQIAAFVRDRRCAAIAIDSVQLAQWSGRELRHLLNVVPTLGLVLAVSQVNKRGESAGRRELEHEADVVLTVEDMHIRVTKSRFQELTDDQHALPVLPADRADARGEVRQAGATVLPLPGVRRASVPPGPEPTR